MGHEEVVTEKRQMCLQFGDYVGRKWCWEIDSLHVSVSGRAVMRWEG